MKRVPACTVTPSRSRTGGSPVALLPLFVLPVVAIALRSRMPGCLFMWALAFSIFAGLKWNTWWRARCRVHHTAKRSLGYLIAWPGMDAESFLDSRTDPLSASQGEWIWACSKTLLGVALLWAAARQIPPQLTLFRGWIGLFGLILLLHFGTFHLMSLLWRSAGIAAVPIMAEPIKSTSLSEFWGKRWNLGFRQLAHDLIFRPFHRSIGVASAGLLVFLTSGLIHDLVISFPARGGYGLPTLYFTIQGLGVALERSHIGRRLGLDRGVRGWLFTFTLTAGPAFWLFHPPFVLHVIIPFTHFTPYEPLPSPAFLRLHPLARGSRTFRNLDRQFSGPIAAALEGGSSTADAA